MCLDLIRAHYLFVLNNVVIFSDIRNEHERMNSLNLWKANLGHHFFFFCLLRSASQGSEVQSIVLSTRKTQLPTRKRAMEWSFSFRIPSRKLVISLTQLTSKQYGSTQSQPVDWSLHRLLIGKIRFVFFFFRFFVSLIL